MRKSYKHTSVNSTSARTNSKYCPSFCEMWILFLRIIYLFLDFIGISWFRARRENRPFAGTNTHNTMVRNDVKDNCRYARKRKYQRTFRCPKYLFWQMYSVCSLRNHVSDVTCMNCDFDCSLFCPLNGITLHRHENNRKWQRTLYTITSVDIYLQNSLIS